MRNLCPLFSLLLLTSALLLTPGKVCFPHCIMMKILSLMALQLYLVFFTPSHIITCKGFILFVFLILTHSQHQIGFQVLNSLHSNDLSAINSFSTIIILILYYIIS